MRMEKEKKTADGNVTETSTGPACGDGATCRRCCPVQHGMPNLFILPPCSEL